MASSIDEAPPKPSPLSSAERSLLAARAARYARATASAHRVALEVVVFVRAAVHYAVRLEHLREVRPLLGHTVIPGASPVVPGVLGYRGEILSAHDLHAYLSTHSTGAQPRWGLVIEHEKERLCLLADDVIGVEAFAETHIKPLPATLADRAACFAGVADRLNCLVLNAAALFETESFFRAC